MKAVILAGGLGTRISEESDTKPKPMVEIGGKPILWHIMSHLAKFGISEFIVAAGYRAYQIKEYFLNYYAHNSDFRVDLETGSVEFMGRHLGLKWSVTVVDTGLHTQTGGRLLRLQHFLKGGDFLLTYGDGLTDLDVGKHLDFHESNSGSSTVLAVRPLARFGRLSIGDSNKVENFAEKPSDEAGWVNGGYFIFKQHVFDFLVDDQTVLEGEPLENLARLGLLKANKHDGFWKAMDTLRDQRDLEKLWSSGSAPWKV